MQPIESTAVQHAAAHLGIVALLVLLYVGTAWLLDLPQLRTAMALAITLGTGAALVASLRKHRTLALVWSELTAWIGVTFWVASLWNAIFAAPTAMVALDMVLGLALLVLGFQVSRSLRRS